DPLRTIFTPEQDTVARRQPSLSEPLAEPPRSARHIFIRVAAGAIAVEIYEEFVRVGRKAFEKVEKRLAAHIFLQCSGAALVHPLCIVEAEASRVTCAT